jgi:uncharacterized protein (UPF0332 family)
MGNFDWDKIEKYLRKDYEPLITFKQKESEEVLSKAKTFLEKVKEFLDEVKKGKIKVG